MSATLVREKVEVMDFKPLRLDIEGRIRHLQAARQTEEVRRAIAGLTEILQLVCPKEMQEICGPTMAIDLTFD